jgi:hypothetical protein
MAKIKDLSQALFEKFQRDIPMTALASESKAAQKEVDRRLQRFYDEVAKTKKENSLWMIGWARLLMNLKHRLLEAGYPQQFVADVIRTALVKTAASR